MIVASLITFVLGGCGGGADDGPRAEVRLDAASDNGLRFAEGRLDATPGPVQIRMANPSNIPHAIGIRGPGVDEQDGETVGGGGESEVVATLEPGTYSLFCPVAGHEQAGMVAKLVVR